MAAAVWAAAAGTLCWLVASGETRSVMDAAPWLALVSWFVYVAQWRPCLHVSDLKSRPHSILPGNERFSHRPAVATGRDEIAKAWQDARAAGLRSSDGTVTTTWNRPMIALGVVVLLWVIAAVLI